MPIAKRIRHPVVALLSLGEPRRFLLRPRGGGASRAFPLGHGDVVAAPNENRVRFRELVSWWYLQVRWASWRIRSSILEEVARISEEIIEPLRSECAAPLAAAV